jgi:putative peptide zinc metalloprotease protein
MDTSIQSPENTTLSLREELQLYPVEADDDGMPAWVIHDPLANRHFRLGQLEVELLAFIPQGQDEKDIARIASEQLLKDINKAQITQLIDFLRRGNLIVCDEAQKNWYRTQRQTLDHKSWLSHLAKSYLFFRIPFWNPDKFLEKTLKYVAWLGSPKIIFILFVVMLFGLISVLHNLDAFFATFLHFFNLPGLGIYFIVLFFVKIMHELGHAYVAKYMGCRVPMIGVAFLVGWPILYTDASDAWKLRSRSKRMMISMAGISVELGIAAISLLCWNFAPEGIMKSLFFLLATTTWILSLMINLNPLMRFDGYYLLSDMLSMPNLEFRSFTMARWWLRGKLFAIKGQEPETIRLPYVCYAFSVWIYRFLLFFGIALLVYHFFFKAAGIALFIVEILYFIVLPIYREVKEWWKLRSLIHVNSTSMRTILVLIFILTLGFIPWSSSIEAPGLIQKQLVTLYTPVAGKIEAILVKNMQDVKQGNILLQMSSPEIEHEIHQVSQRYKELSWKRDSLGFDENQRSQALVVSSELKTQLQRLYGLTSKQEKLQISSPVDGVVTDRVTNLNQGNWVAKGQPVLSVLSHEAAYVIAYVSEHHLSRIKAGFSGRFYPEDPQLQPLKVTLLDIDQMGIRYLDSLYMASTYGGDIAVREKQGEHIIPVESFYKIRLKINSSTEIPTRILRGVVRLEGETESFYQRAKRYLTAVFIREASF